MPQQVLKLSALPGIARKPSPEGGAEAGLPSTTLLSVCIKLQKADSLVHVTFTFACLAGTPKRSSLLESCCHPLVLLVLLLPSHHTASCMGEG